MTYTPTFRSTPGVSNARTAFDVIGDFFDRHLAPAPSRQKNRPTGKLRPGASRSR
jgi:hypothetical protein